MYEILDVYANDTHFTQIIQRVENHCKLLEPLDAELALFDVVLKRLYFGGRIEFASGFFGNLCGIISDRFQSTQAKQHTCALAFLTC